MHSYITLALASDDLKGGCKHSGHWRSYTIINGQLRANLKRTSLQEPLTNWGLGPAELGPNSDKDDIFSSSCSYFHIRTAVFNVFIAQIHNQFHTDWSCNFQ